MKIILLLAMTLASFTTFAQHAEIQCENLNDGTLVFLNVKSRAQISLSQNYFGFKGMKGPLELKLDDGQTSKKKDFYHFEGSDPEDSLKFQIEKFKIKGQGYTFKELQAEFEVSKKDKDVATKKYKCLFYE
jgi:hypothetical protein